MSRGRTRGSRGFSVIELLVATAIASLAMSAVFAMLNPSTGAFQTQPAAADLLQRLRAATDALSRDLGAAGAAPAAVNAPRLAHAAVFPLRIGRRSPDPAGTFDSTRISFWTVESGAPQALLTAPLLSASGTAIIANGPGCADGDATCGFHSGSTVVLFGAGGALDLFSVTAISANVLTLQHNLRDSPLVYAVGTPIAEAVIRTYYVKEDRTLGFRQLMEYDGAGGNDVPVIDHVVWMTMEYVGEAEGPSMVPGAPGETPRASYGPVPPDAVVVANGYPAGENCVFARGPSNSVVPRLAALGTASGLVALDASMLTDGPWCPDAASPNRYDADLLRVRQVIVNLRVEAADASLRGPAGPLFARGGTARGPRIVPDRVSRVVLSPRSLNVNR